MFSSLTGRCAITATVISLYRTYPLMFFPSFFVLNKSYSLMLRRECCSFSYGEYVKTGLAELEQWCQNATEEVIEMSQIFSGFFQQLAY